jgi:hypothetical protein
MKNGGQAKKQLRALKRNILPILARNDVVRAGVFGSFVRGKLSKTSDIDILVKFKGSKSLLDVVGLKLGLEEKLKRKVDLVEYSVIHPLLKRRIFEEEARIL